uniref:Uncharacterized protein n=1 Tax=Physcomitrium patens TaxID=3218 RepID=A0A2K1IFH6_PHYPA|nr:hypothetical protein PHYPA_028621 [Physcomitrium patens]
MKAPSYLCASNKETDNESRQVLIKYLQAVQHSLLSNGSDQSCKVFDCHIVLLSTFSRYRSFRTSTHDFNPDIRLQGIMFLEKLELDSCGDQADERICGPRH